MKRLLPLIGLIVLIFVLVVVNPFEAQESHQGASDQAAVLTVERLEDGGWIPLGNHGFETEYTTHTFKAESGKGELVLRIHQQGGDFADLEQVSALACGQQLQVQEAFYTDTQEDVTADISQDDHNVIIIHDREVELSIEIPSACTEEIAIDVKANAYGHAFPFRYPEEGNLSYVMGSNSGTLNVDGLLDEVDGKEQPDYSPLWEPVTGHPDGKTHVYLKDDADFFYVALDVTMDNTNEEGEDWTEVVVSTDQGQETFRVDDENTEYGICGFGLTSMVNYKHQTCEFNIPKNNLNSEEIEFAIRYYGTGGGGGPGSWVLDTTDPFDSGPVLGASAVSYNNKIYLFGGYDDDTGDTLDNVQIYDPTQPAGSRWSTDSTDPMPGERSHGGAVLVGTSIYYLLGRSGSDTGDLEDAVFIYDPAAADGARWTTGTAVGGSNARQSFAYAADGTDIYIIGGMDNTNGGPTMYSDVFSYDTIGDTWDTATLTSMPVTRSRTTAQNIGGVIYVAGGGSTDLRTYTVATDTWGTGASFTGGYGPMAPCSAQFSTDFYVISHYDEVETYRYDTVGNSWTQTENLNEVRMRCAATELNGTLYAFGGFDDDAGDFWDDFETLSVAQLPLAPTLNYPDDNSARAGVVILSAQYIHSGATTGTTEYRVSTGSAADCLSNTNIEATSTSAATATVNEPTFVNVGTLTDGTKYWCARNNDGTLQSAWTTMGEFDQDSSAPYLNYGTFFGGSSSDTVIANIQYYNDEVYVAGSTQSADFPTTAGAYDQTKSTTSTGFIAKFELNGAGNADLIASTFFEPVSSINDLFVDSSGVYAVGQTNDGSFPTAGGAGGTPYDSTWNSGASTADSFISRFNHSLASLEYSTFFGGTTFDQASEVFVESGTTYVVGNATSSFPTTVGAYDTSYSGTGFNMYISAFNLGGNGASDLLYSSYFGNDDVFSNDLFVDAGIMYIGGYVDTSGQPITAGAFDSTKAGFGDESILVVFEPLGAELTYATYVGGSSQESISRLTYDTTTSTVIACGNTTSADFYTTPGAYDTLSASGGFVFRLDPSGNGVADMQYASLLGAGSSGCGGIAFSSGDVFITLNATAAFSTTSNAYGTTTSGNAIMRMNLGGNGASDRKYASYIGTVQTSLIADGNTMYLAATTSDPLYPILADPGGTPYDSVLDSNGDGAIVRIVFPAGPPGAPTLSLDVIGNGEVDLSIVPGATNGSAHTDFVWEYKEASSGVFLVFVDGSGTSTTVTITDLLNGILYDFRAAGVNGAGQGAYSNVVQGTPLGSGGNRRVIPTGGAIFYFGNVERAAGSSQIGGAQNFANRTSRFNLFEGGSFASSGTSAQGGDGAEPGADAAGEGGGLKASADTAPQQVQDDNIESRFRNISVEEYIRSNVRTDQTDAVLILDLVVSLQWLMEWYSEGKDYQLSRKYNNLSGRFQKLFRTRWFHYVAGVTYIERIRKVSYNFEYLFPIKNETENVLYMMRSILLTFGRACFSPEVLAYAEEVDYVGNELWYYRYFLIMKPWMDAVLGERGYAFSRDTGDIDALRAVFILMHQFCLGGGFETLTVEEDHPLIG